MKAFFSSLEFEEASVFYMDVTSQCFFSSKPSVEDIENYIKDTYLLDSEYSFQCFEMGKYLYFIIFDSSDSLSRIARFNLDKI